MFTYKYDCIFAAYIVALPGLRSPIPGSLGILIIFFLLLYSIKGDWGQWLLLWPFSFVPIFAAHVRWPCSTVPFVTSRSCVH